MKGGDGVFKPGWQILDMSSPYQDFLVEQTLEVLKRFKPVDGLFFDMCWDQPSTTKWAIAGMVKEDFNPELEDDRAKYAHLVSLRYMRRLHDLVKKHAKGATVYFNSRPLLGLEEDLACMTQTEIEALPSGGWGYMYFPKNVRFVRTFSKPCLGMTARFHKGWADFGGIKNYAALEYETSQMMAHGAGCSIGDQLHPRRALDAAAYELIGRVYERVEAHEPWLVGAKSAAEIGVLIQPTGGSDEGVNRMLTQLKHQFNFITESSDWDGYELLVLSDAVSVSEKLADKTPPAHRRRQRRAGHGHERAFAGWQRRDSDGTGGEIGGSFTIHSDVCSLREADQPRHSVDGSCDVRPIGASRGDRRRGEPGDGR